jgi:hypothetical protein
MDGLAACVVPSSLPDMRGRMTIDNQASRAGISCSTGAHSIAGLVDLAYCR